LAPGIFDYSYVEVLIVRSVSDKVKGLALTDGLSYVAGYKAVWKYVSACVYMSIGVVVL
jgi:hypothetical protein